MADKIKIGIDAQLNTQGVDKVAGDLGKKLDAVTKKKINPVDPSAKRDLETINRLFEQLMRVDGDLRRRAKGSNQLGVPYEQFNWEAAYANPHSRARKRAQFDEYVNGAGATHGGPAPAGGGGGGGGVSGAASNAMHAGLNAAGSLGRAASAGIRGGASGGFGMGASMFLGSLASDMAQKLVGAIADNVEKANDNNIAYDKLKRTLGDVNVSFAGLKAAVVGAGDNLKITYDESARLSLQYAKAANLKGQDYKDLPGELGVGVGMSRAFGLDPAQGVGVLGQMRGVGVTASSQETRRFALLIGETIGKSGAFAKADEVMEAMGNYAISQTRNNMGGANVEGYAGAFAGLVGSGIPGLDPQGAANLLSRVNSALSAGGAKGEASQFFTARVGASMGLDPIQTQLMREGGMFSTNKSTFGPDSIASKYGLAGPGGDKTYFQATMEGLRGAYGDNKGLLAQATANHLGVNMRQAMALQMLDPSKMGELQKGLTEDEISKMGFSGLGNMAIARYGSKSDIADLSRSYLGRRDVDASQKEELRKAMESGNESGQRDILAKMAAQYDQDRTTGSEIRDIRAQTDNIAVALADKIAPAINAMRAGIVLMAGKGKKTQNELMKEFGELEQKDRLASIATDYSSKRKSAYDKADKIKAERDEALADLKKNRANMTPEQIAEAQKRISGLSEQYALAQEEARQAVIQTYGDEKKAVEREKSGTAAPSVGAGPGASASMSALSDIKDPQQRKNAAAFLDTIGLSEGANHNTLVGKGKFNREVTDLSRHPNVVGMRTKDGPSTAAGKYQITNSTWKSLGKKPGDSFSPEEQDKAAIALIKRRGAWNDVLAGNWDAAVAKLGNEWQSLPSGTSPNQGKHSKAQFYKYLNESLKKQEGTPVPEDGKAGPGKDPSNKVDVNVNLGEARIIHENSRGEKVRPDQSLQPTFAMGTQKFQAA